MTQNNTVSVECLWSIDIDSGEHHFVKLTFQSGRVMAKYWPDIAFQKSFENVPDESPVASVTVDGEKLPGVKSVDIDYDNGAAPEPHEGNGKAKPEIDWKGEVECRPKNATGRRYCWRPFRVHHWCEEMSDSVIGTQSTHWQPYTYLFADWEFRNKPKPEPRWESAGDDRPIDCQRKTLWQVWRLQGGVCPQVLHTFESAHIAARYAAHWRTKHAMCGDIFEGDVRFVVTPCKAPVMPEAAEVGA